MSGFELIADASNVEQMLTAMAAKLEPVRVVDFLDDKVDPYFQDRMRARFKDEGDSTVGKWAPLSEYTKKERRSRGYGAAHPINRQTGELEDYIVNAGNATSADFGARIAYPGEEGSKEIKRKLKVAQKGAPAKGGFRATPARPVLGMDENDLAYVMLVLAGYIEGAQ